MVFVAALLVRLTAVVVWHHPHPHGPLDGYEMERVARNLYLGRGFASPLPPFAQPTAWLAPAIPLLWWGIFVLFGGNELAVARAIVAEQLLVSAGSVVMFWLLARRIAGRSNLAARSFPTLLAAVLAVWPETLLHLDYAWYFQWQGLAVVTAMYLATWWDDSPTPGRALALGAVAGITALINPSPLPVIAVAFAVPVLRRWPIDLRAVRAAVAGGLVALVLVLPWTYRNYRVFHELIPLRSNLGVELWAANNPNGSVRLWQSSPHPFTDSLELARYNAMGERAYMRDSKARALAYISSHPARTVLRTGARFYVFWFYDVTGRWSWNGAGSRWWEWGWRIVAGGVLGFLCAYTAIAVFLAGLWRGAARRMPWAYLPLTVLALLPLPYYLTPVSRVKSFGLQPWLLLVGIYGLLSARAVTRSRSRAPAGPGEA